MFAVYCPGHEGRVLLFPEHIRRLVNRAAAIELHWQCTCGSTGIHVVDRDDQPLAA